MRKLRSILFATDLRSESREISDVAIRLALAADARVTLLHVLEPISRLSPTPSALLSGVCGVLQVEPTVGFSHATGGLKRVSETALQDVAAQLTSQNVELGENALAEMFRDGFPFRRHGQCSRRTCRDAIATPCRQ